jgi:hypothetical protein
VIKCYLNICLIINWSFLKYFQRALMLTMPWGWTFWFPYHENMIMSWVTIVFYQYQYHIKNYFHNIYVSEIISYLSSHLTHYGFDTLAKLCLLLKILTKCCDGSDLSNPLRGDYCMGDCNRIWTYFCSWEILKLFL